MPISLADLTKATRSLTLEYDGSTVALTYYPGKLTPAVEARLNQANADNRPAGGVAEELARLIASWDVLDAKGKPEPITVELLRELPTRFLLAMVSAIGADARPNASSAGS